ncbi:MAG: T9SS type A sorting domain-containing protein [Bacteroidales bacterium]
MRKQLIISFLFLVSAQLMAQQNFIHSYGFYGYNQGVEIMAHTNGYLVAGNTSYPGGNTQVYLVKIDTDGQVCWEHAFYTHAITHINQATIISPDSILMSGMQYVDQTSEYDPLIALVDSSGGILWDTTLSQKGWQDITAHHRHHHSLLFASTSVTDSLNHTQVKLTKLNYQTKTFTHEHIFTDTLLQKINSLDMIGDSIIIAAGTAQHNSLNYSTAKVMMLDTGFSLIRDTIFIDTAENQILAIKYTDPEIITAGYLEITGKKKQEWIVRLHPDQMTFHSKLGGGAEDDMLTDIAVTKHGYLFFTGTTESFGGGKKDIRYSIHDQYGNWKNSGNYGDLDNETGHSIITDDSSRMIICGTSESWGPNFSNIVVIRTDSANMNVPYTNHFTDAAYPSKHHQWKIYPNPVKEKVYITLPPTRGNQPQHLVLMNMQGEIVRQTTTKQSNIHFSLNNLRAGIYIIHLQGTALSAKIIKQ